MYINDCIVDIELLTYKMYNNVCNITVTVCATVPFLDHLGDKFWDHFLPVIAITLYTSVFNVDHFMIETTLTVAILRLSCDAVLYASA